MIRLPCTNLNDFIWGLKHFYSVGKGNYARGQRVILYNDHDQALFRIEHIHHLEGRDVLGLIRVSE